MASHETPSNGSQLNGDYPMKKCKSSNIALHFYEKNISQKLLKVADTLKQKNVNKHTSFQ